MGLFIRNREIECPCCKNVIASPDFSGIYRCRKCKSEIVETYDKKSKSEQVRVALLVFSSTVIASITSLTMEIGFIELLVIYFLSVAVLCVLFRVPLMKTIKPEVSYAFVGGLSYPDQQLKKHQELTKWLNDSEHDFIGFVRYIVNSSYVSGVIDKDSLAFFKELNLKTEDLPSAKQVHNWRSAFLYEDLDLVNEIKEKYNSEFKNHIDDLRTLAEGVNYFSE